MNQDRLNDLADSLNETIHQVTEVADQPGEPEIFFVDPQTTFTGTTCALAQGYRRSTASSSPSPLPKTH